jgi:CheY-like chemotaxis protein
LSLVKSFVEAHRGTIEATSEGELKGSTFIVRLPRQRTEKRASHERPARSAMDTAGSRARILIVEDQPDTLEMLAAIFEKRGYEVVACDSAGQAVEVFGRKEFDVLISDVGMPSMDGLQLIKTIRERSGDKRLPAIALTGYASQNDAAAAIAAGFDRHLSKPVDPNELAEAVERLLHSRDE